MDSTEKIGSTGMARVYHLRIGYRRDWCRDGAGIRRTSFDSTTDCLCSRLCLVFIRGVAIPPAFLRSVHCGVGLSQQRIGLLAMLGKAAYTNAQTRIQVSSACEDGQVHSFDDSEGESFDGFERRQP